VRQRNRDIARVEAAALPDEGKRDVVIELPNELR